LENKSVIQAEGKAHNEDTAKAGIQFKPKITPQEVKAKLGAKEKKIPIPEKTYEALKTQAKAEGKTTDELATKVIEEKAKAKSQKKGTESAAFPTNGKINDYGFLHFRKAWLADLGWTNGMTLKVEKNADGSITIRKV